ncbi:unnamed protein product [Sympodiomycopsis kandeliae]
MEGILRKRLKDWQKEFRLAHGGREPRRSDIAKVPEIAALYETWTAMSAANGGEGESSTSRSRKEEKRPSKSRSSDMRNEKGKGRDHGSPNGNPQQQKRPAIPTTPTKSSGRSMSHGNHIFKTPTKPSSASSSNAFASATTPRRSDSQSTSRNPFKTPTKGADDRISPVTPSSAVKLRTPRQDGSPNEPSTSHLDPSFHFHYNTSPSSFRTLVGQHSSSQSPNRRPRTSQTQSLDHDLQKIYTPRTKARKRLRGDEVPPTPESAAADRPQTAISNANLQSPSKSKNRPSRSSLQEGMLQPGPVDPRPRKRRAERTLGAYWGASQTDESKDQSQANDSSSSLFQRTISQPQTVSGSRQASEEDEDDPDLLQASPSTSGRKAQIGSRKGTRGPTSPSATRSLQHRSQSDGTKRKFQSLFSQDEDKMDDVVGDFLNEDVEVQSNPSNELLTEPTIGSGRTLGRTLSQPQQQEEILLDDFSSSSESESDKKKHGRGQGNQKRSNASVSPSKAAYVRAYRRLGALSLSRHDSRGVKERRREDEEDHDASNESDGDDSDWNPSRFYALPNPKCDNAERVQSTDVQPTAESSTSTPATQEDAVPSTILNHRPRALRSLHQAEQTRASSILSNLGLVEPSNASSSSSKSTSNPITLENAAKDLGVIIERTGFKACAEGQETDLFPKNKPTSSWGAAKAANKKTQYKDNREDDEFAPRDKKSGKLMLGRAKRGFDSSLGTAVLSDEEGESAAKDKGKKKDLAPFANKAMIFKRVGRSGVDDDEFTTSNSNKTSPRKKSNQVDDEDDFSEDEGPSDDHGHGHGLDDDDDWQSDVDSLDWGVGDGRMEAEDVM